MEPMRITVILHLSTAWSIQRLVNSKWGLTLKPCLENESKPIIIFFISQDILADLKGPKGKIICTMYDVRGDFLGPPHGTTPASVIRNKNKIEII